MIVSPTRTWRTMGQGQRGPRLREVPAMMLWHHGGWGFAGLFGMGMMLLLWGALIGLAIWAIARFTHAESTPGMTLEAARAILDRRFAAGEIDAEEYASARRVLESHGVPRLTASTS
jgi:putative membrane protein